VGNPYHDPRNGRFTSRAALGAGLAAGLEKKATKAKYSIKPDQNAVFAHDPATGKEIGHLGWRAITKRGEWNDEQGRFDRITLGHDIEMVGVHPDYRRQGIATELLNQARTIVPDIMHSSQQTADGRAFAAATGGLARERLLENPPMDDSLDWPDARSGRGEKWGGKNWNKKWWDDFKAGRIK
jgi:GNAT superfamily N-acetyltransferase